MCGLTFFQSVVFVMCVVYLYQNTAAVPAQCALESTCSTNVTEVKKVCIFDEDNGCIRQYASKCHLEIAACRLAKNFTDYSDVYCDLDTYLCGNGYERWTIFFGSEK